MKWLLLLVAVCACATERDREGGTSTGRVHPSGILDEESENFHGKELARRGYDLKICASCHGDDFTGGKAGASCTTCHTDGPTACVTCHGDGPTSGNHVVHRVDGMLACAECHTVPAAWDSPGHIGAVEVTFGPLASKKPASFVDGACTVYCHGTQRPAWDAEPVRGCDRCHGAPPPSPHPPQPQCASCHPAGAAHLDGITQVGSTCDGCHGRAGDPAPPRDLSGNEFTTALGVGAHQVQHLPRSSGDDERGRSHRYTTPRRGHAGPRLGSRGGDVRHRVVPRALATRVDAERRCLLRLLSRRPAGDAEP